MPITFIFTATPAPTPTPTPIPAPRVISRSVRQRNKLVKHLQMHPHDVSAAAKLERLRNLTT